MEMEEFFEKSGMDKEEYEKELDEAAKVVVKRALVLEALDANDIQWTLRTEAPKFTALRSVHA